MARNLEKLLGESMATKIALSELRRMSGDDSDVRLIADILVRGHSIIRALGFDPSDSTAMEVYQALMAQAPRIEQTAWAKASDWVLMDFDGQIISFHPLDIVENYHHQLPLGRQHTTHGKRCLGQEIARRYSDHPATHTPSVERVVCDGGICWLERDEREAKRKLAENFAHKASGKTSPAKTDEPILASVKKKKPKKQRAEKKLTPRKPKKFTKQNRRKNRTQRKI